MSLWLGIQASENEMYGIIGEIADFPMKEVIFWVCVILGGILVFVTLCGLCTAWKRLLLCHWVFAFIVTLAAMIFLALGIGLIVASAQAKEQLNDLWAGGEADTDFQRALQELYSKADIIYCKTPPIGCVCYTTHTPVATNITFSLVETANTVRNVQTCKEHLEKAYSQYGIDFSSVEEYVEYLDYFKKIEEEYDWSGICDKKQVYYFSDSSRGEPPKRCKEAIQDELLDGEVLPIGIGYLVTGIVVTVIWIIQYGLCCRDKEQMNQWKRDKRYHDRF